MLNIPLVDSTFKEIRDYIYEKSGIYIADNKKYLIENRLSRILKEKGLNSFEEYLELLRFRADTNELNRLFDAITTNETYFFREAEQFYVLSDNILPKLMAQKKNPKNIRIWSAACSTGEEPYTISIILMEKMLNPRQIEICASDISEGVLNSAKRAVYNSYSVRNIPEAYLKKYFLNSDQSYALKPSVKNTVKFMNVNLVDDKKLRAFRGMDVIFCRNVLIYFDNKAKQKAVSNIYNSLNPGGYLFIGSSESLHNVTMAFRPNVINKVIAYQKV
ncbi:MAG: protein-glutamate O-methyltransferase [Deferribacteres bacterium]|nr:protein-glutamate O-methyltransferase [Deferribacteres bacterium]